MNLHNLLTRWCQLGHLVRYDFAHVRENVVAAIEEVMADGYKTFVGKVMLEQKASDRTSLTIVVMAKNTDGTYTTYSASQDFYSMINIPSFISDELITNRCYEVCLSMDDMRTIYHDRIMEMNSSNKDLDSIVANKLHRMGIRDCGVTINITDVGIYYKVKVYEDSNPTSTILTLLTLSVNGINGSDMDRLATLHNLQLHIDVI